MDTPSYEDVQKVREELSNLGYAQWLHDDFLSWRWWLQVGLTIIPLFIWCLILDKRRIREIHFYGLIIALLSGILESIGTNFVWWGYPHKLFPVIPPIIPPDLVFVPICLMVVYQLFSRSFILFLASNIVMGAFLAYIAESIFIWLGFYRLVSWKLHYSFLFYVISAVIVRWIIIGTKEKV